MQKLEIDRDTVITQLQVYRYIIRNERIEETDVRLIVFSDFSFEMARGDVQYDTVHGVYCGSSMIGRYDTNDAIRETADDLIAQVQDQFAEGAS